ncbi:hypothetical protein BKA65DRAFT_545317 [Rhexocercosporidium sp. MPI-PUGE-AT-0058]|nr:hypothetical protein BKA65DRAFT_545317 [Rhexocercosporidium sp. MPI-PUGE-AT-0058]
MQFANTLLTLAAIASTVSVGCYTSGETWGWTANSDAARGAAIDLCKNGQLAGYFNQGQSKTWCANLPNGNMKVDFQVIWQGQGGLALRGADSSGGSSDPNNDRC